MLNIPLDDGPGVWNGAEGRLVQAPWIFMGKGLALPTLVTCTVSPCKFALYLSLPSWPFYCRGERNALVRYIYIYIVARDHHCYFPFGFFGSVEANGCCDRFHFAALAGEILPSVHEIDVMTVLLRYSWRVPLLK